MNRQITLRAATSFDEPFLLQLRKLTMNGHLQRAGIATDDETHYQRLRSNFDDAKIICDAEKSIGLLKLTRERTEWHVHQIQILPGHQGRGIGQAVLKAVLVEATAARVPVSLGVLHGNPARRLYERLGFKTVSETAKSTTLMWHP